MPPASGWEERLAFIRFPALTTAGQQELEPTAQTIRKWLEQAGVDAGTRSDGLTSAEREELRQLRRENKQLMVEREIPPNAAAWFARESGSIPGRDSSS